MPEAFITVFSRHYRCINDNPVCLSTIKTYGTFCSNKCGIYNSYLCYRLTSNITDKLNNLFANYTSEEFCNLTFDVQNTDHNFSGFGYKIVCKNVNFICLCNIANNDNSFRVIPSNGLDKAYPYVNIFSTYTNAIKYMSNHRNNSLYTIVSIIKKKIGE